MKRSCAKVKAECNAGLAKTSRNGITKPEPLGKFKTEGFNTGAFVDESKRFRYYSDGSDNIDYKKPFKIGNPDTDKGHWVTIKGNHVFIKDE